MQNLSGPGSEQSLQVLLQNFLLLSNLMENLTRLLQQGRDRGPPLDQHRLGLLGPEVMFFISGFIGLG